MRSSWKRPKAADVVPLDFGGEPIVLGWMPAASLYLRDPDEFLSMLPNSPQPELGIVGWSRWNQIHESVQVGWALARHPLKNPQCRPAHSNFGIVGKQNWNPTILACTSYRDTRELTEAEVKD